MYLPIFLLLTEACLILVPLGGYGRQKYEGVTRGTVVEFDMYRYERNAICIFAYEVSIRYNMSTRTIYSGSTRCGIKVNFRKSNAR